jgi:hypothetical protein
MVKLYSVTGLALAIAIYGEGKYSFITGTYKVFVIDNDSTTHLIEFSIDQATSKVVMLSSMSSIKGNLSEMREFEYRASQWFYRYEYYNFDSCELLGNTFVCTDPTNGCELFYTITKVNDNFDPSFNLLGETVKNIPDDVGSTCYNISQGCKCYLSGYSSPYNLDLACGGAKVREREDWSSPVAIKSSNSSSITITVDDISLDLKAFSQCQYKQLFSGMAI